MGQILNKKWDEMQECLKKSRNSTKFSKYAKRNI